MGKKIKVLKPPKITKYVAMSENTTRWQAKGENFTYWSNQIRGNAWKYRTIPGHKIVSNGKTLNLLKTSDMWQFWKIAQCLKIPTKDVSHGNTTRFSATELSIFEGTTRLPATGKNLSYSIWSHQHGNFENTTRLQATGEHLSYWSHPIFGHIWGYTKFTTNGGIFKSLKPPNMWQCLKIPQDCRQGKIWIIEAPQYFAAAQYLAIFENTTRLSETSKTFYLLKPPNISQCLKIPQDWRPRGEIEVLEATQYFAIFENTTKFSAARKCRGKI